MVPQLSGSLRDSQSSLPVSSSPQDDQMTDSWGICLFRVQVRKLYSFLGLICPISSSTWFPVMIVTIPCAVTVSICLYKFIRWQSFYSMLCSCVHPGAGISHPQNGVGSCSYNVEQSLKSKTKLTNYFYRR